MQFTVSLPEWAVEQNRKLPTHISRLEDRMRKVIEFSRLNIENQTGGPFAAGVFERDTGKVVVIGINRVVPSNVSSAHAEVVALSLTQQYHLSNWDLGGANMPALELVVNWRPCAMCYGAVIWSGIRSLVIAGSDNAVERITGFDEGPIHPQWKEQLLARGIDIQDGLLYDEAIHVFELFRAAGCLVYNGRQGE